MSDNLEAIARRTRRYWYEDGFGEMGAGAIFIVLGLLFYAGTVLPPDSPLDSISVIGLPLVLIGGYAALRRVVEACKVRFTYPRTGYVAYPERPHPARRSVAALVVGAATAAGVMVLLLRGPASIDWMPLIEGTLAAGIFAYLGYSLGLLRLLALAAVSLLLGLALAAAGLSEGLQNALFYGLTGVALVLSGAAALSTYLAHTRPPTEV